MLDAHLLSLVTFLPLVGVVLLYLVPPAAAGSAATHGHQHADPHAAGAEFGVHRFIALSTSLIVFVLSLLLLLGFEPQQSGYQFVERADWIKPIGASYFLGVDGISLFLVILTTLLMPIIILASRSVQRRVRDYLAHMLVLETAMLGTLLALDVLLFYVFWELMLAPMYFIIGIWGGARRIYATLKFVLYTVAGSLLMLVAIIYTVWNHYEQTQQVSFALQDLLQATNFSFSEQVWLFVAFALAFGIKVPLFPFHTWLPDAHVEAPTGGSVVLAGVLLKMGLYGFIRFAYPLFPLGATYCAPYLALLALIGIIYGALVAWAQVDIKKLVAYSSVSHLGFCMLGLVAGSSLIGNSEVALTGSIYQMLNHGVSTGALFLLVGVLYDRKHTRLMADYGGLASKVPVFAFLLMVFTLSSIALPLTNGFIGEFLILSGSFSAYPLMTACAVSGVVLGAVYMLSLYKSVVFGELDQAKNGDLTDVSRGEIYCFAPLFALVFLMGLFPQYALDRIQPSVRAHLAQLHGNMQRQAQVLGATLPVALAAQVQAQPASHFIQVAALPIASEGERMQAKANLLLN